MANVLTVQTLLDGPRNTVIKVEGILDTSDQASTAIIDPALLTGIDYTGANKALKLRLKDVKFVIEDALTVNLYWDATAPVLLESLNGRDKHCYDDFGGINNNAGAGVTGKVMLSTEGWTAGIKSFSLILSWIKQQT